MAGTPGGIPCEDIDKLQARCKAGPPSKAQMRVTLTDTSHDGETVVFSIDGTPFPRTIFGNVAGFQMDVASGMHTIALDDPAACVAPVVVNCH